MLPEMRCGIQLNNGRILETQKISELTDYIIDKFAEEKLSMEEAVLILKNAEDSVKECSIVQKITSP